MLATEKIYQLLYEGGMWNMVEFCVGSFSDQFYDNSSISNCLSSYFVWNREVISEEQDVLFNQKAWENITLVVI